MHITQTDKQTQTHTRTQDGACIIFACMLVGVITAWNEQAKENQFRGLQKMQDDCAVTVKVWVCVRMTVPS